MTVWFYAPMKSPASPKPSGDRTFARLLMSVLEPLGGVHLASECISWLRTPDTHEMARVRTEAGVEIERILQTPAELAPHAWVTYTNYYRAPDLIGPAVADQFGIPYLMIEASYARKRDHDAWAPWQAEAITAFRRADVILPVTERDRFGLEELGLPADVLMTLPPFLDVAAFRSAPRSSPPTDDRPLALLVVAMMREGAKRRSYAFLADALRQLPDKNWTLDIVGDGSARTAIETDFAFAEAQQVRWRGALPTQAVATLMREADLFVWPGFDEAFGMAYLEAQAVGLPVIALATAGVPSVVRDGQSGVLVDGADPQRFAQVIADLGRDTETRDRLSNAALQYVETHHSIETASRTLEAALNRATIRQRQR